LLLVPQLPMSRGQEEAVCAVPTLSHVARLGQRLHRRVPVARPVLGDAEGVPASPYQGRALQGPLGSCDGAVVLAELHRWASRQEPRQLDLAVIVLGKVRAQLVVELPRLAEGRRRLVGPVALMQEKAQSEITTCEIRAIGLQAAMDVDQLLARGQAAA